MNKHKKSNNHSLRLSEMIPFIGKKKELINKAFLIPGILTVLLVVGLFYSLSNPKVFNLLLGTYLMGSGYYFIYRQVGRSKPWWLLLSSAVITFILLNTPCLHVFFYVFKVILPGQDITDPNPGFIPLFISNFFGAGMLEELFKALPVFLALGIGRMLKSPWRERIGVWEPLDGILLGAASAAGFTLFETLAQYVPQAIAAAGGETGLQLLIARLIGEVSGHMAYSGYFGYFIGLSVLKPSKRWLILAVGYLTASTLHALWNSIPFGTDTLAGAAAQALVGILAYTCLMAAILKARQLSKNRPQNWATQYLDPPSSSLPTYPPAPSSSVLASCCLSIQQRLMPLELGTQVQTREIPGLGSKFRGIVAEVTAHPQDPSKLGLKNCSYQVWIVTLTNGQQTNIDPGRSIKLTIGTRINFGAVTGEIRAYPLPTLRV
jgi:RsiW-degrading membrane proteinase PrsW (M82 family)